MYEDHISHTVTASSQSQLLHKYIAVISYEVCGEQLFYLFAPRTLSTMLYLELLFVNCMGKQNISVRTSNH